MKSTLALPWLGLAIVLAVCACSHNSADTQAPLKPPCDHAFVMQINSTESEIVEAINSQDADRAEKALDEFRSTNRPAACSAYTVSGGSKALENFTGEGAIEKWQGWIAEVRSASKIKAAAKAAWRFSAPNFSEIYQPHNKSVHGDGDLKDLAATFSQQTNRLFGYKRYAIVLRSGLKTAETVDSEYVALPEPRLSEYLQVKITDPQDTLVPFISGYSIRQPEGYGQITMINGSYHLKVGDPQLKWLNIAFQRDSKLKLTSKLRDILTRPVDIQPSEWPEKVRAKESEISALIKDGKISLESAAQEVEVLVSNQFRYSLGINGEMDIVKAVNSGAFQCDAAAMLMVSLLREWQIPSRVVVGYRTSSHSGGKSEMSLQQDAHAWVEAYFIDRGWQSFDPTPTNVEEDPTIFKVSASYLCSVADCGGDKSTED